MTRKERSAIYYQKRKENGLCPQCGNPIDREGYYCSECLKKNNDYKRENRKFRIKYHICTYCGKVSVPKSEKTCPECRAIRDKYRNSVTAEQKEKYRKRFRVQQNLLYKQRKEKGICTRCGRRESLQGKAKCAICTAKYAEKYREKN